MLTGGLEKIKGRKIDAVVERHGEENVFGNRDLEKSTLSEV